MFRLILTKQLLNPYLSPEYAARVSVRCCETEADIIYVGWIWWDYLQ